MRQMQVENFIKNTFMFVGKGAHWPGNLYRRLWSTCTDFPILYSRVFISAATI